MAGLIKLIVLLVVLAAVAGTTAYLAYELYFKPKQEERAEELELAARPDPTPPPDPSLPHFEKAAEVEAGGDLLESRDAWRIFIAEHPTSTRINEAKERLGEINTRIVFSPLPTPDKEVYTVVRGDAMARLASRFNVNGELIMRANNLMTHNLQVDQQLVIPKLDLSLSYDREARTLTLYDGGQFFKEYAVLSERLPGVVQPVTTKVSDRLAMVDSERVAFGTKEYFGSDRWLMLAQPGYTIRAVPETDEDGFEPAMPAGIVVERPDMEEIFSLVVRGTPVIIR